MTAVVSGGRMNGHGRGKRSIVRGASIAGALTLLLCVTATAAAEVDLLVINATLFDARTGETVGGMAVSVADGAVKDVAPTDELKGLEAVRSIDAAGRLVTPGFIDTHGHLVDVLATSFSAGGGGIANLSMAPDSVEAYRRKFSAAYLPHGVTAVRDAGSSESYLPLMTAWMERDPAAPDFFPCGGALVSHEEGRTPYDGHAVVADTFEAAGRVREYRDAGFRFVKLYWRLREPEVRAALRTAGELEMVAFAHIDRGVYTIAEALDLGLLHFEHAFTLGTEVLGGDVAEDVTIRAIHEILKGDRRGAFFMATAEQFNEIGEGNERMLALIRELSERGATVTPTVHVIAKPLGLTVGDSSPKGDFDDTSGWTPESLERARRGYDVMMSYVVAMHEQGVRLAIGSDTVDPGAAVISELLLLHEAGIPMRSVLQIATHGSAEVMELSDLFGSLEPGKRAHFIVFDESPLDDPGALMRGKTVVKDGVVWEGP